MGILNGNLNGGFEWGCKRFEQGLYRAVIQADLDTTEVILMF